MAPWSLQAGPKVVRDLKLPPNCLLWQQKPVEIAVPTEGGQVQHAAVGVV